MMISEETKPRIGHKSPGPIHGLPAPRYGKLSCRQHERYLPRRSLQLDALFSTKTKIFKNSPSNSSSEQQTKENPLEFRSPFCQNQWAEAGTSWGTAPSWSRTRGASPTSPARRRSQAARSRPRRRRTEPPTGKCRTPARACMHLQGMFGRGSRTRSVRAMSPSCCHARSQKRRRPSLSPSLSPPSLFKRC